MSNETHISVQELEKKIIQLLKHYKYQKAMIQKLQQENRQLKQQIASEDNEDYRSPNSLAIDIATRGRNKKQADELGNRLDNYIRDIDNCIAHLEQF